MTATLGRRLGAVERRMGVGSGPFAEFSDADLLAAVEWIGTALGEGGSETLARGDTEEAELVNFHERSDVARRLDLEQGWRWPYQRAVALRWERSHQGPRSAATLEELQARIEAAIWKVQ